MILVFDISIKKKTWRVTDIYEIGGRGCVTGPGSTNQTDHDLQPGLGWAGPDKADFTSAGQARIRWIHLSTLFFSVSTEQRNKEKPSDRQVSGVEGRRTQPPPHLSLPNPSSSSSPSAVAFARSLARIDSRVLSRPDRGSWWANLHSRLPP